MMLSNNKLNITINIFTHYPETLNSTIINDKLNEYFIKYFKENYTFNFEYEINSYVSINSAPHCECQSIDLNIEINDSFKLINKDKIVNEWKNYLDNYFHNQFKDIKIEINNI